MGASSIRRALVPALLAIALAVPAGAHAQGGLVRQLIETVRNGPQEALDPLVTRVQFRGGRTAAFRIARFLRSDDPDVRERASYVLGILQVHGTERALERVVDDSDWSVRKNAIFALGKLKDRRAVRAIAKALADPERPVRLQAARSLVTLADPRAGRDLVRALKKVGDDRQLEMVLLDALGRCRWRGARRALEGKLKDGSEAVRLAALRALAILGDRKARLSLLTRLDDPAAYARVDAARILGEVPGKWSDGALRTALTDHSPKVRVAAAEALGAHGDVVGLRFLVRQVDEGGPEISLAAADALQRLKVPEKRLAKIRAAMHRANRAKAKGGDPPAPGDPPAHAPPPGHASLSGASAPAAAKPPRPSPLEVARRVHDEPFPARLDAISRAFLGTRYLESPLGEGAGYDPDPLIRYDAVDCVTYVETVLALANDPSPHHLLPTLLDIRYRDGQVAFGHRNHLMMDEWIPENERKGFVRDITRTIAGAKTQVATKVLTAAEWKHRRGVDLPLSASEIPLGTSRLAYVPIADFPKVMDKIPDGTILLVVRTDRPDEPIRVTHLGFVFRWHGHLVLRHAAKAIWHQVTDERLADFVARNAAYKKWPVVGFALLEPEPRSGRVAKATTTEATPGE